MEVCCTQVTRRHSHETNGKRVQLQHAETLARPALRTGRSSLARRGALKRYHRVFSASWPGFISPSTLGTPSSSPLRSLTLFNGHRTAWTPGMNRVCSTPSLHLFTRRHQNSLVIDQAVQMCRSVVVRLSNLVRCVRPSPRLVTFAPRMP
jgi:hypothetical protein